ncbi:MAG: tape measure protein, partial [Polaromonas sp.]
TATANQQAAANKRADDSMQGMGRTANGLGDVFSQLGPIFAAAFTGREMVQTIAQTESLKLGLTAVLGSSQAAATEWEFLKKTSSELGLELQSTGQAYLSLTAATKGTAIEGAQTREVFTAVSRAMSMLGKSGTETERALQAVSQMASKGTVSMEELRGQLGEALPGALKAAADGAGITTAQLIQMVSTGDVLAKDLLPALTKGLNAVYAGGAPPDTLTANWNRFKNAISETSISLGESGLTKALADAAIAGTKTVGVLGESFVGLGKGIGKVAGAVATLDFGPLADDLGRATFSAEQFGETAYDAMGNAIGVVNQLPPALGEVAAGLDTTGRSAAAAGQAAQEGFRKTEIAAQNASNSILKNAQVYGDLEVAIKQRLELADKAVKAADAEAKVVLMVAEAFGTEAEKRQAVVLATQIQAEAQNQELAAKREALKIAQQKLDQMQNELKGITALDDAQKKAKEALELSVKVKTEEVRVSEAQSKAYGIIAAASSALAQAYADNSTRVYELRAAMVAATEAAAAKREEFAKGKGTVEQVSAADLAAKSAALLYRDAINDLVTATKIREQQIAQKNVTQQKENDLNVEAITSTLELAKARGDEGTATRAQTALTQAMVSAKRDAAASLHAEADAARASADAEESAARAAEGLTTEKKAQIEAIRESARQKDIDARKTEILA